LAIGKKTSEGFTVESKHVKYGLLYVLLILEAHLQCHLW